MAGGWLCVAVAVAAPVIAGGVHRVPLSVFMIAGAVGITLFAWGTAAEGRTIRIGSPVLLPLVLLAIPLLQSVPLPLAARRVVDPKGTALLQATGTQSAAAPLSLDPPSTRVEIGKAALGLIIFLIAFHRGSGTRHRHSLLRAVGAAGIAAVTIGIAQRILGVTKIYGFIPIPDRGLLIGPFVNANHTAELLELSSFVCLACSFLRPTALNRFGWLTGTLLCLGGVAATTSRGGAVAVAAGVLVFTFLRYLAKDESGLRRPRASLAWGALLLGLVVLAAGAFGAGKLIDRFQSTAITSDIRFRVWRDSLHVLAAHPAGIGRGVFDRVFPIYRTLTTPGLSFRFAFVENEPLQLLIDSGWLFYAGLVASFGLVVWWIARHGLRDRIEAALVAGLLAVLVHNLVDFGLETPGVLLPFMAILGTTLGRIQAARARPANWSSWPVVAVASLALLVGAGSVAHASYDDFDALLKRTHDENARRELLRRAERAHPLDYYYPLTVAPLEPVKSPEGGPSPRFHALNQALLLCPTCEAVHVEIARDLWRLRQRRQALLEWRTAIGLQPRLLSSTLGELFAVGATPEELASVVSDDPLRLIEVADFLSARSRPAEALRVLAQADALGVSPAQTVLVRGKLELELGQTDKARDILAEAHRLGIQDARLTLLDVKVILSTKGAAGADEALALLDRAATQHPFDLNVQRTRLDVVTTYDKWRAADRALDGLREALYRTRGSAAEAHIAAARTYARMSRWTKALDEYAIAAAEARGDVRLWMEYGRAAASAGRNVIAHDAYLEAARLSPQDPEVVRALGTVDHQQATLRARDVETRQP